MPDAHGRPDTLAGVLEPVLTVPDEDDAALAEAIDQVADTMAAAGALILDAMGQPAHCVSDEAAVIGALDTYAYTLLHLGRVDEAADLSDLIDRIHRLGVRRSRRGSRAA